MSTRTYHHQIRERIVASRQEKEDKDEMGGVVSLAISRAGQLLPCPLSITPSHVTFQLRRQNYTRVVIGGLQKTHQRTAPGNRRKESAFIPFNRKTAIWRQEKRRRRK